MAIFKPFAAIRPRPELAERVAALPYDVMNTEEARQMAAHNPYSFLHVDRAEIDLSPSTHPYDASVYAKAASTLRQMREDGVYIQDDVPCFYIYREIMGNHSQMGLVGCASVEDYANHRIKKHELTRADKEQDRIRHVDACNANTGPIFLTYRPQNAITRCLTAWTTTHTAVYDFTSDDHVRHTVWKIDDIPTISNLEALFAEVPYFYIADGHHRAASAFHIGMKRRAEHPNFTGNEAFNYFLAVLFPSNTLNLMPYNRYVHDLNDMTADTLLNQLSNVCMVTQLNHQYIPRHKHEAGMYLEGSWYSLCFKDSTYNTLDSVEQLDVSILQKQVLAPLFGIHDPRTDKRIEFIGGIRGLDALKTLVDSQGGAAFALYPTTVADLMQIADEDKIMPPKSTWFEPKLRSGLFIHEFH